jgi:hypothetical protein
MIIFATFIAGLMCGTVCTAILVNYYSLQCELFEDELSDEENIDGI